MLGRFCLLSAVLLTFACDKSEKSDPGPSSATSASAGAAPASVSPKSAPSGAALASAAPATSGDEAKPATSASGTVDPKKADTGRATSGSASAAGSASAGPAECGTKPLPDCPLQAWMKSNANPPVMTSDLAKLAVALDKIVTFAPSGYTNWASIAKDGAAAARSGDLTAAKASCRTCHDQYKQKYKTEMRARKI